MSDLVHIVSVHFLAFLIYTLTESEFMERPSSVWKQSMISLCFTEKEKEKTTPES
jgi:hypothetical protein